MYYTVNTSLVNLNSPIKTTDLPMYSRLVEDDVPAIVYLAKAIIENALILPEDSIRELKHAGLLEGLFEHGGLMSLINPPKYLLDI